MVVLDSRRASAGARSRASAGGSLRGRLRARCRTRRPGPSRAPVTTTRVTVIDPMPLSAEHQARAWLDELDRDREVTRRWRSSTASIHSHRLAAADPYVHELTAAQALVDPGRLGRGRAGRRRSLDARARAAAGSAWPATLRSAAARGADADRGARCTLERFAALLGGACEPLLCEELTLRARQDLDSGRLAHAALELRAGARARPSRSCAARAARIWRSGVDELEQLSDGCGVQTQALEAARAGPRARAAHRTTRSSAHALERLEAALRARQRRPSNLNGAMQPTRPRSAPGAGDASCTSASRWRRSAWSRCCARAAASTR